MNEYKLKITLIELIERTYRAVLWMKLIVLRVHRLTEAVGVSRACQPTSHKNLWKEQKE